MMTYFCRHTRDLDVDDDTRHQIWENRKIAIHFPQDNRGKLQDEDASSIDPDDYAGSARRALRALVNLAAEGGYVCSQHYRFDEVQIGYVLPGSRIELMSGKWGKIHGYEGRTAILKTVQLNRVRSVKPSDHAIILVGRPRQGTLMRWPSAGKVIENLVEGRTTAAGIEILSPDQQEILCSEFLRSAEASSFGLPRLAHLILPVGRTMKDIDIIGIAKDGKRIFAQVTFAPFEAVYWKLNRLRHYKSEDGDHLLLFCDVEKSQVTSGITIFPIITAFDRFTSDGPGKLWLEQATALKSSTVV
jgi:hypothetical protein